MAYVSQETKAKIVATVKPVLKKYGLSGTFAVRNHSTLSLTLKSGKIDFIENYIKVDAEKPYARHLSSDQVTTIRKQSHLDVNPYWFHDHFSGRAKAALTEIFAAIKKGGSWFDNSDAQIDYFNTAFYIDVNVGKWNKPYQVK